MKRSILTSLILLSLLLLSISCSKKKDLPDYESTKEVIDVFILSVSEKIGDYHEKVVDLSDVSTQGGLIKGYYLNESLQYIITEVFGEMGKIEYVIYYINKSITFLKISEITYDKPIYIDDFSIINEITNEYVLIDGNMYEYNNDFNPLDVNKVSEYKDFIDEINEKLLRAAIIQEGENYKVIKIDINEESKYKYSIYNSKGEIVQEEVAERIPPKITEYEDMLEISFGGGTNAVSCLYYDIKNDRFSNYFFNPAVVENGLIVYMDGVDDDISLIIQNIFDEKTFYLKVDRDFSNVGQAEMDLVKASFIDENQLEIVYLRGEDQIETTEILKLK